MNNVPLIKDLSAIWKQSEERVLEMITGKKLTVPRAAEMLGVNRAEVYLMIAEGQLMAFKLKTHYRIPEKSVIDFIARKMAASALE